VKDHRSQLLRNLLRETIKFMYTIKQLNLSNKVRYKYISSLISRNLTYPKLHPNSILTGALIDVCLASLVVPGNQRTAQIAPTCGGVAAPASLD
jgi:hypothetical protein